MFFPSDGVGSEDGDVSMEVSDGDWDDENDNEESPPSTLPDMDGESIDDDPVRPRPSR